MKSIVSAQYFGRIILQVQEPGDLRYNNAHSLCHNGILCNVGIRNVSKQLLYEELTHRLPYTLIRLLESHSQPTGLDTTR
jgi:hypothetical protein